MTSRPEEKQDAKDTAEPDQKAAELADDLGHHPALDRHRRRRARLHRRTGRVVLRLEGSTEDKFDGQQAKAEVFVTAYTADTDDPAIPARHLRLQRRARILQRVAAPRPARPAPGHDGRRGDLLPRRTRWPTTRRPCSGTATWCSSTRCRPGTPGRSRARSPSEFHGYGGDIESVGEVIRLWTTRNGRWMSPKYLCGESYGTTRAAGLARYLQERYGMYLNGLMLVSAVPGLRHRRVHRRERRAVRHVPADVRGRRALPRQARRPAAAGRTGRGARSTPSASTRGSSAAVPG